MFGFALIRTTAQKASPMTITVYHNGTVFTGSTAAPPAEAFAVADGRFLACGSASAVADAARSLASAANAATEVQAVDLSGSFVMPAFVEAHTHLLMLGQALEKVQLRDCNSIAEVQERLRQARAENPDAKHLFGVGWRFEIFDDAQPTAALIDSVVADIPVILDANDLHSAWVNTAALAALGIDEHTPDPHGGEIVRDANGQATGYLIESAAILIAWPFAENAVDDAGRDSFLDTAAAAYLAAGVTTVTEMAGNPTILATLLRRLERDGRLPLVTNMHWLIRPDSEVANVVAQVEEAAALRDELAASYGTDWLRLIGIKIVSDGVIDGCTAAMHEPYITGAHPAPIWSSEAAVAAAVRAHELDLQVAFHAIGDAAVTLGCEVFEAAKERQPGHDLRPRIEHLEYVSEETFARLAENNITASMQPVHADPAVLKNWQAVLGDARAEGGFAWQKMREARVPVVLGSDAPTAPHETLPNLFIAVTGRSALQPELEPYHPERAFTPAAALTAMTHTAAWATHRDEELGQIAPGLRAHFTVLDHNPLTADAETVLCGAVLQTFVDGAEVYSRR